MSRIAKLHLYSGLYCAVLVSLNWSWHTTYARQYGLQHESISPVGAAAILSVVVVAVLGWRVLHSARVRLETGERVPPGRWIEAWSVALYALPLLWHNVSSGSWKTADGAIATKSGGFGSELSGWIFLFAVAGMLLAQVHRRLAAR